MLKYFSCVLTTLALIVWAITMDVNAGLCASILVTCTLNSLNRE